MEIHPSNYFTLFLVSYGSAFTPGLLEDIDSLFLITYSNSLSRIIFRV